MAKIKRWSPKRSSRRRKSPIPGMSFSWKRAVGITKMKQKVSRKIGIPLTKQGMQRKVGKGCLSILIPWY